MRKTSKMFVTVLSIGMLFFSCAQAVKEDSKAKDENKVAQLPAVAWEVLLTGTQCAIAEPGELLISSEKDLQALWKEAFAGVDMAPEMPVIDFTKHRVIAVFMGMVRKGGHAVSFQEISTSKAIIRYSKPGANCMSAAVIEFPFAIARVTGSMEELLFEKVVAEVDCE